MAVPCVRCCHPDWLILQIMCDITLWGKDSIQGRERFFWCILVKVRRGRGCSNVSPTEPALWCILWKVRTDFCSISSVLWVYFSWAKCKVRPFASNFAPLHQTSILCIKLRSCESNFDPLHQTSILYIKLCSSASHQGVDDWLFSVSTFDSSARAFSVLLSDFWCG